ncbi:S-adenosyl-L-methionine-dependent methyltransferase [Guyanagaster necrorhizus]|uniref:S-adenosyl-L-methionine-dependent methyltransferase n=1 Tax=Guyanagaster necrorhizus TaxID=856835 RepID=A0A9P7VVB4_9AGAR|nr:S-adenosyl-L-methionine-dependent methyltransferase [Guyanagaster necrorhizus MCA 3950]KAG7447579.1 S-adenosyl-L-methionine-dependent methyltransferase [Guyanagaster necrorhizus MCA 3950]
MISSVRRFVPRSVRSLASISSSHVGPFAVFDRKAKQLQRDRAAAKDGGKSSATVDYVRDEVADRLLERLEDINRKFSTILDLGSGPGHFARLLGPENATRCIMIEPSEKTLYRDPDTSFEVPVERIHADEEELLQIVEPNTQEAIVSCLSLQWINDLPGMLVQINRALRPDGLFLGAMFGGETLFELRTSLQLAEVDREGGISPHVSPMTDTRDVSNLLGRAGFTLLTVDIDEVKVAYPSMWELMDDLRDMGESNAVIGRRHFIHRDTLTAASAIYKELHGNEDGTVPATFQVIFMIGWKPDPSQAKPVDKKSTMQNVI